MSSGICDEDLFPSKNRQTVCSGSIRTNLFRQGNPKLSESLEKNARKRIIRTPQISTAKINNQSNSFFPVRHSKKKKRINNNLKRV